MLKGTSVTDGTVGFKRIWFYIYFNLILKRLSLINMGNERICTFDCNIYSKYIIGYNFSIIFSQTKTMFEKSTFKVLVYHFLM
jgi:hypothetical protein